MYIVVKRVVGAAICLLPLLFASCLTMTMPKGAQVEPHGKATASTDRRLVDTWELLYQVTENGQEERPPEGTRTLIEFTDKGRVIINRVDKDNPERTKSQTGTYGAENNEISLTDGDGNNAKWTYAVDGDKLVITAPEAKMKFHWRRYR